MKVHLNAGERLHVAQAGVLRQLSNLNREDAHGFNGDGWGINIEGCAAEYAVAKVTDQHWTPWVKDFTTLSGDVGYGGDQVRSTPLEHGHLPLHRGDPDGVRWFLVTGKIPDLNVVGFLPADQDGKLEEHWRDDIREPCFLVPQSELVKV